MVIIISLFEFIFLMIPEIIVIYILANSFAGNRLTINKVLQSSIVCSSLFFGVKVALNGPREALVGYLMSIVIYSLAAKINIIKGFILLALSYGIKLISECIVIGVCEILDIDIGVILGDSILRAIFSYIALILPIFIIKINVKKNTNLIKFDKKQANKKEKNKVIIYMLICVGATNIFIIAGLIAAIASNEISIYSEYGLASICIVISTLLCIISLIIVVIGLEKSKDVVLIERNLMENTLKQMEESVDILRIQKHDVMNHLQIILMQISGGKTEDARRYILGLAEDVKNVGIVFDTGNNYIDAILNFKNRKCIDSQIELTACIDSLLDNTRLDDTQLSSIILNIIDNAIDELKKHEKEYKYIHIDTYCESNKHIISIKNNGSKIEDTNKIFEMGVSSKGINRGYGLYSIKQLLHKYKSKIYVVSDEEETEFIIEIPINKKELDAIINV